MRVIDHRQFVKHKPQPRRWRRFIGIGAVSVVALLALLNGGLWLAYHGKVLPNYSVGRASVGGVSFDDISKRVTADSVLTAHLNLTVNGRAAMVTPVEMGISSDTAATIATLKRSRPLLPMFSLVKDHVVPVRVAVDDTAFMAKAIALQQTFSKQAIGTHIVFRDNAFHAAAPEAGFLLDVTRLKAAVADAAATGKADVQVPTIPIPAPAPSASMQSEVDTLQKQLSVPIGFVYDTKTQKPAVADMGKWYVAEGASMTPSRDRIAKYIEATAKKLGVTPVNTGEAVSAVLYALAKNQTLSFRLSGTQGTTVYRYCVAQRGLDDSVLGALKLKLAATYGDTRGWNDKGRITFVYSEAGCEMRVWLAAPATMTSFGSICDDYYSCTVFPNVIINNDRWNGATDPWNAQRLGIEDYDAMVINHESGHWLGFDHVTCPAAGQPAPVMQQQSVELGGCVFNPWPLASETARAAR